MARMSNLQAVGQYAACIKSNKTKSYICEHCGQEFKLHRGELLYQHDKKNFCSYNCRSKYKAQKGVKNGCLND